MMTKPYYERDGVTIYCGRWQDVVPGITVDAGSVVVSDPPYGTGGWRRMEAGAGDDPTASLVVEAWDDGATEFVSAFAGASAILAFWPAARTGYLLAAADAAGLTKHRAVYLHKPDPKPQVGGRIAWSVEPVWVMSRDGYVLYGKQDWHEARMPRANRDIEAVGHPYQKPLTAMRWLVSMTREPLVIDPFMGSGSTLFAARDMGRQSIGIEIEERYCEIAVQRLQQSVMAFA